MLRTTKSSMQATFVAALLVGAWAGCGSDSTEGGSSLGGMNGYPSSSGGGTTTGSSSGSTGSSSGSTGSSSGSTSTGSSSGSTSTGSSSGSTTGSSSGGTGSSSGSSSGGATPEAGPAPLTLQEALTQFASCMSYTAFTSTTATGSSAADIAKSQTTQYGDCNACHNAGDGGFWASYGTVQGQNMTQMMFNMTQQFPYITKWVTGTVDTQGNFKDLAPSNAIANQAALASQCQAGTPCHPKFQLNPNVVSAINDFVTNTIAAWHAGTCGSTATPPADAGAD
jgi:hypothetical protein